MRRICWFAGVLMAAGTTAAAAAADPPVERLNIPPRVVPRIEWSLPASTPAEQVKYVIDRQKQLRADFRNKYLAAKSEAEKERLFETEYYDPETPARLLLEVAGKHPRDPAMFDALLWVVRSTPRPPNKPNVPFARARDALMKDFARHPRIGEFCRLLSYEEHHVPTVAFVREVYEKHPEPAARAHAGLARASHLRRHAGLAESWRRDNEAVRDSIVKAYGREYGDYLRNLDVAAINKEVGAVLDRLVGDKELAKASFEHRDKTRTVGEAADAELFEIRHLLLGKPVPEVAGEDIDGKPFKLSDYRGKVVLLDFWGDW